MIKAISYTILALIAFAANSVLCKMALGEKLIDATSFSTIRLFSGGIMLFIITIIKNTKINHNTSSKKGWKSSLVLFLYAICFSYAYITLDTGTGALILFGIVQLTIVLHAYFIGNKLGKYEWTGIIIAFLGFVYLIFPNISTPSLMGLVLMIISGISWGLYTIYGQNSKTPLIDTTNNFIKSTPFIALAFIINYNHIEIEPKGLIIAIASGAITSGIGYTIWYIALRYISAIQSAVIQLFVPILAAFGGVLFLSELISIRLLIASLLILGGVLIILLNKKKITP